MEYKVVYTGRKTVAIYLRKNGEVEVRCPKNVSKAFIENFVTKKLSWIEKTKQKLLEREKSVSKVIISEEKRLEMIERANKLIPKIVDYYSKLMEVSPTKIKISSAKSYWGSCSGTNAIKFSWRLMLASDEAIHYVVVHELAHIKQHNHSNKFWREIEKLVPEYKLYKEELRELQRKIG